jgi:hypothetical protein
MMVIKYKKEKRESLLVKRLPLMHVLLFIYARKTTFFVLFLFSFFYQLNSSPLYHCSFSSTSKLTYVFVCCSLTCLCSESESAVLCSAFNSHLVDKGKQKKEIHISWLSIFVARIIKMYALFSWYRLFRFLLLLSEDR